MDHFALGSPPMLRRQLKLDRVQQLVHDIQDGQALQALAPLTGNFLPWSGFTMRATAILAIANDITLNERRAIVECGSGNSTLFAARALAQSGHEGHIHSIDHHPKWASVTRTAIEREGLQRWASVTCAPLVDTWYDSALLPDVDEIDLLVVDGPPADAPSIAMARLPALDVFHECLSPGATIILDDSQRRGEKRVIAAWHDRHGIQLQHRPGGYAIAGWEKT